MKISPTGRALSESSASARAFLFVRTGVAVGMAAGGRLGVPEAVLEAPQSHAPGRTRRRCA